VRDGYEIAELILPKVLLSPVYKSHSRVSIHQSSSFIVGVKNVEPLISPSVLTEIVRSNVAFTAGLNIANGEETLFRPWLPRFRFTNDETNGEIPAFCGRVSSASRRTPGTKAPLG